jgi:hypothetical protein
MSSVGENIGDAIASDMPHVFVQHAQLPGCAL